MKCFFSFTLLTHDGVFWGSDLFVDGVSVRDLFKRSLSLQLHLVMQILHTSPSMHNKATKLSREGKNSNHPASLNLSGFITFGLLMRTAE